MYLSSAVAKASMSCEYVSAFQSLSSRDIMRFRRVYEFMSRNFRSPISIFPLARSQCDLTHNLCKSTNAIKASLIQGKAKEYRFKTLQRVLPLQIMECSRTPQLARNLFYVIVIKIEDYDCSLRHKKLFKSVSTYSRQS